MNFVRGLFIVFMSLVLGSCGAAGLKYELGMFEQVPCPESPPAGACVADVPWPEGQPVTPATVSEYRLKVLEALTQCKTRDEAWETKHQSCKETLQ